MENRSSGIGVVAELAEWRGSRIGGVAACPERHNKRFYLRGAGAVSGDSCDMAVAVPVRSRCGEW